MLLRSHVAVKLLASAVLLNWHYVLLGQPVAQALFNSRPLLKLINGMMHVALPGALSKQGVPRPNSTMVYSDGPRRGRVDVFLPGDGGEAPRPAIMYFHGGAFISGTRTMGAGTCGWLSSHGTACFSVSYRLTGSGLRGAGVAGCIEDAWAALRWLRANAAELNVDPNRIVAMGDSAGSLLALSLGTGLDPSSAAPIARSERPAAIIGGWPVSTLGALTYAPRRSADGKTWEPTPAANEFRVENVFVPTKRFGGTAAKTQARLRTVLAGGLLCFGRTWCGLLPAVSRFPADDDAASVSPLRLADQSGLPPMLLMSGGDDTVVPCEQTSQFAEAARAAGNEVAEIIFDGAPHGGGGVNSIAGREATLDFLQRHAILHGAAARRSSRDAAEVAPTIQGAMRAFGLKGVEYERQGRFRPSGTVRLRPVVS